MSFFTLYNKWKTLMTSPSHYPTQNLCKGKKEKKTQNPTHPLSNFFHQTLFKFPPHYSTLLSLLSKLSLLGQRPTLPFCLLDITSNFLVWSNPCPLHDIPTKTPLLLQGLANPYFKSHTAHWSVQKTLIHLALLCTETACLHFTMVEGDGRADHT